MTYRITPASKRLQGGLIGFLVVGIIGFILADAAWLRGLGLVVGVSCFVLIGIVIYFYRDPERSCPASPDLIVAPADGYITSIEKVREDRYLKKDVWRIAIFMHVGNVHVQRVPSDGVLSQSDHCPGKFRAVMDPKAAIENEQRWYAFDNGERSYAVVQIAGLLARRTMNWLEKGTRYARGTRLGMIALGSKVDLYLPDAVDIIAKQGAKVKGGESILARWTE